MPGKCVRMDRSAEICMRWRRVLGRIRHAQEIGNEQMRVVYEAGPCGYVIVRPLRQLGIDCVVIAPSMIPKMRGDEVKTDRRVLTVAC